MIMKFLMTCYPEVSIEDGVDDRVEGGVGVAQPVDKVIKLFFSVTNVPG